MFPSFSRTDLARKTREILGVVRRGEPAVIRSYGKDQAVLVDPLDYQLLRQLADLATAPSGGDSGPSPRESLLGRYLHREISLSKVAEVLEISRFELMERFERLGVPLELGPETPEAARAEVETARSFE